MGATGIYIKMRKPCGLDEITMYLEQLLTFNYEMSKRTNVLLIMIYLEAAEKLIISSVIKITIICYTDVSVT